MPTMRIKAKEWSMLNNLCVKATIELREPVSQSKILHSLINEIFREYSNKELIEIYKSELQKEMKVA